MPRVSARSSDSAASKPTKHLHGSDAESELRDEDAIEVEVSDALTKAYGVVELMERDLNGNKQFQVLEYTIGGGAVIRTKALYEPTLYSALAYQYLERAVNEKYIQSTLHEVNPA